MKRLLWILPLCISCAYFNTFYNARQSYKQALNAKSKEPDKIPPATLELFDKSIEKSAIIIRKHPRSRWVDDALLLMGRCYYEKNEYVRARDKFEALEIFYPNSPLRFEAAYYRALAHIAEKNFGLAIVALTELAARNPKYEERCSFHLGAVHFLQADYVKSIELDQAFLVRFRSGSYRGLVWTRIGDAATAQRDYPTALEAYTQALKYTDDKVQSKAIKLKIAESYLASREYAGGLAFLKHEAEPEFVVRRAKILKASGQKDEHLRLLKELARTQLENEMAAEVFHEIGLVYQAEEKYDTALIYFDSSYARAATTECGENSIRCKQTINKILDYRAKSQDEPARAQFLLAELYFVNLSDTSRALLEYEKVYQSYPDSPFAAKAMYAYAWITDQSHTQDSLARVAYLRLIEKYPDTEYAQAARQRVGE